MAIAALDDAASREVVAMLDPAMDDPAALLDARAPTAWQTRELAPSLGCANASAAQSAWTPAEGPAAAPSVELAGVPPLADLATHF